MERKHHINFWYVIIAFWAVMIIQSYWASYARNWLPRLYDPTPDGGPVPDGPFRA